MRSRYLEKCYREEINELTGRLRASAVAAPEGQDPRRHMRGALAEHWADLRAILRRKGVKLNATLLVSLLEDGDGLEYGVLVTPERRVIDFSRRIRVHRLGPRLLTWRDRTGDRAFRREFPQIAVALKMVARRLSEISTTRII
jgi:hypothetical protein